LAYFRIINEKNYFALKIMTNAKTQTNQPRLKKFLGLKISGKFETSQKNFLQKIGSQKF